MILKEQIRAARACLGMSKKELSKISGISYVQIQRIEKGSGPLECHAATLFKLQQVLQESGITFLNTPKPGILYDAKEN